MASGMALSLVLVAAVADNGVIGRAGGLPWRLKSDMQRFRALTFGHPVLMGRKTYQSIGKPLPGRTARPQNRATICAGGLGAWSRPWLGNAKSATATN